MFSDNERRTATLVRLGDLVMLHPSNPPPTHMQKRRREITVNQLVKSFQIQGVRTNKEFDKLFNSLHIPYDNYIRQSVRLKLNLR